MAKRDRGKTEQKIEEFAEDLGRLLGTARAKAEGWIGQRQKIAQQLAEISKTASALYNQLTGHIPVSRRGPGRPKGPGRKRRRMSAEARRRISEAQRKRWATRKAAAKK